MATSLQRTHAAGLTDVQRAWIAGIFEGEGCFSIHKPSTRDGKTLVVAVGMTDEDVVRTLASLVGTGSIALQKRLPPRKDMWCWRTQGKDAVAFFKIVEPWLHSRRKARWKELFEERLAYERTLPAMFSERNRINASKPRKPKRQNEALF